MDYQLTHNPNQIIRLSDGYLIPNAPNGDWQAFQQWLADGGVPLSADPLPPTPPNWDALRDRLLMGDLHPIFSRLTTASLAPDANTISTARGDIITVLCYVKQEAALASALALLSIGGYAFTDAERAAWAAAVDELNFSNTVYLP